MSEYTRDTELRNVQPNDLYRLAVILDENDYWRKLMEIIPKELNNQLFGESADISSVFSALSTSERKYERDQIRLVEKAFKRSADRLCPQILFDEWGSSGRKHERPTLGVLLHLLLYAQLFRAADFVAVTLLKESELSRPADGPGAVITIDLPSIFFDDIHKMANESENYPDTELLQHNANCFSSPMDNNKDYYTKYREPFEKIFAPPISTGNPNDGPPIPPPRLLKSARLQIMQQQSQLSLTQSSEKVQATASTTNHGIYTINEQEPQQQATNINAGSENNIPKITILMNATRTGGIDESSNDLSTAFADSLPMLDILRGNSNRNIEISDDISSSNSIPNIIYTNNINQHRITNEANCDLNVNHDLPAISALNLNGERDSNASRVMRSVENVPSVALNFDTTNSGNNDVNVDFNIPSIVAHIAKKENLKQQHDGATEVNVIGRNIEIDSNFDNQDKDDYKDYVEEEDDDDDDVPNLSIFNDSSLTSVTNTSGENSFEHLVIESGPVSADSALNV